MNYRYFVCDVFTDQRFSGNPLAVVPEAEGLSERLMQQIAREFNFSETTFVFPPEHGQTRKVRIFTPVREIPFAGHPNIGTAFVLAHDGALGNIDSGLEVVFEEVPDQARGFSSLHQLVRIRLHVGNSGQHVDELLRHEQNIVLWTESK